MNVKGEIVKSILNFIATKHSIFFDEWLNSLPASSKEIYTYHINGSSWYVSDEAIIMPIRILSHIIYKNETMGARECGMYFAQNTYSGTSGIISKLFSPKYTISKGCRTFISCFEASELEIVNYERQNSTIRITHLDNPDSIIENWFTGLLEQALQSSGCKNITIKKPRSLVNGDNSTEITINWK